MARLYASNLGTIEAIREGCKRNRGSIHKFSQRIEEHNLLLVIRSVEGTSVSGGKYSEEDAKVIVRQILSIMAFCHIQGVVHRDLKPENFLFTTKDEHAPMKAIDFGLSDFIRPDERLNDIVGSTYYVAPEVLHRSYRMGANVWSVGVITYILLCGSRPFWARTESGIFRAVLRADPNFDDAPWPSVSPDAKDFVKILLNNTCAQALTHPWLRGQHAIPLDILIFRLFKAYIRASPLKQAALKVVSKLLTENELFYLRSALMRSSIEAMKESKVLDILNSMEHIASRKMDFEEFCAAAISIYQLEALDQWENIASSAYEFFEQEGNKVISVEELAREMNLAPTAHIVLQDWMRSTDGKLGFHGFTKFLHGVAVHSKYQASINASQIEERNLLLMIHSIEVTFISVGKVEVLVSRYGLFLCDFPKDIWLHIYRNIMGSSKLDGSPAAPDGNPFSLSF